jgi:hypothetical protein
MAALIVLGRSLLGPGATRMAALVVLGSSLLLCAVSEVWYLSVDQPVGFDEGYIGGLALRLLSGRMLPGVDGVGQRGPVFYWLATIAQFLGGRFSWAGMRWLAWAAASAVVLGLYALGRLCRRPLAGALGGAFYAYALFKVFEPGSGIAVNGEQICAPFVCWATLAALAAARSREGESRWRWSFLAGLLAAIAGWTKVSFLLVALPLGLWLLAFQGAEPGRSFSARVRELLPFAFGWILPLYFMLVAYGAAGALGEFVYRFVTYNTEVYMGVITDTYRSTIIREWLFGRPPRFTAVTFVGSGCAFVLYLNTLVDRSRKQGLRAALFSTDVIVLAFAQLFLAYASGISQSRFWNHHFAAAMPWVGLLVGLAVGAFVTRVDRRGLSAYSAAGVWLLTAATLWSLATAGKETWKREKQRRKGAWIRASEDPLCREIGKRTDPKDTIFVWGFDGDLYVSCARYPASRFVYTTLIAGIVPPFWKVRRPDRVARDAPAQAASDIAKARPALILDLPAKLKGVGIKKIPELRAQVRRDYCKLGKFTGLHGRRATFYGRKDRGFCQKGGKKSGKRPMK